MRNVWLIFRNDVSTLFQNVMSVILTVGLVVLPSLFAWYNILACWDVFENTGNLSVAVANEDEGYTSDLLPLNVNIGEKVVAGLRGNDQINWVFTDTDDAIEGTEAGTYYAALVIPSDFSRQMLTFYEGSQGSAKIDYYVNEKKNAIAPNITNTGAGAVSAAINETFAQTLSEVATAIGQSLSKLAEEGDVDGTIATLADNMRSVGNRLDQTADVMQLYSSLATNSQDVMDGSADLIETARSKIANVKDNIEEDKQVLRDLVAALSASLDDLSRIVDGNEGALASLEAQADALLAGASDDVSAAAGKLRDKAAQIDAKADELSDAIASLKNVPKTMRTESDKQSEAHVSGKKVDVDITVDTQVVYEHALLVESDLSAMQKAVKVLKKTATSLRSAAKALESGDARVQEKAESLQASVAKAKSEIESVKSSLRDALKPDADKLKADIETLAADLDQASQRLDALDPDLSGAVSAAGSALGQAAGKVDGSVAKLRAAAQKMRDLADAVDDALASGNMELLRSLLQGNVDDLATALTAPVKVERVALFPAENFGSAMTPLYCALALFIGSLLIMVAMKPEVTGRRLEQLTNPKPRQLYFGRFGVVALVSLMQTTLLGLGNMVFLGVQVDDPWLFMLAFWFGGLVFAFIVYTLVVAFGNLGKAIAVLLLIVQVTACGGSYPLQLLPDFVQAISPWVPATYIVDAMRSAMMGVYLDDYWVSMGHLALFIVPFLLLGLALRKPLERFMKFYVSKVEECGIME